MYLIKTSLIFGSLFILFLLACNKDTSTSDVEIIGNELTLPIVPYNYSDPSLPMFFQNQFVSIQNNTPNNNPVTDWGATLGRVLFYDKDLSKNHTISCASCHIQAFGFTDTVQFSGGVHGGFTRRHTMALANATFYLNGRFFWDERAQTLENQVLMPIQDTLEMGMNSNELIQRIAAKKHYPILFKYAFGNQTIDTLKIANALSQFIRSMISYRSKYDIGRATAVDRYVDFNNFTAEENIGKSIFMTHPIINCFGCHNTDVFIMDNPRNNGLTIDNVDNGVFIHTQQQNDMGKFKSPSLKNVMLRNRFMHDGSILGIDNVIEHYNSGIMPNVNLDPHLKNNNNIPKMMNLSQQEINALKAFLSTLTDNEFIHDPKFGSPYK